MIKKNSLVRIGKGRRVYRVSLAGFDGVTEKYRLAADAKHPDAAVRVPDAFAAYTADELVEVTA